MSNTVKQVVEPYRELFVARADAAAQEYVCSTRARIDACGGDFCAVVGARPPLTDVSAHRAWEKSKSRFLEFYSWAHRGDSYEFDESKASNYLQKAHTKAVKDFDRFVIRLAENIGPDVVHARVESEEPWVVGFLTAVDSQHIEHVWQFRMVVSHTKHGKPFYQFPLRRLRPTKYWLTSSRTTAGH